MMDGSGSVQIMTDPDPAEPKTCGSNRYGFSTLLKTLRNYDKYLAS
jgi:hypothetical protein